MMESGLMPVPVILDFRQQRFAARLANSCSSHLKELNRDSSSGTPICGVVKTEQNDVLTTEGICRPALGEASVVKTNILEDQSIAKCAV
jgi:ribosomal protein S8E